MREEGCIRPRDYMDKPGCLEEANMLEADVFAVMTIPLTSRARRFLAGFGLLWMTAQSVL